MRGMRVLVGVLFGMSVALAACDSEPPTPTPDPSIAVALAAACAGDAVSGAADVSTSGTAANHLVLLNFDGSPSDAGRWLPDAWAPYSLSDAELVACWQSEEYKKVVEVCPYTGSDITRYDVSRDLAVFAAKTGSSVADFTITAQPRSCRQTENANLTEIEAYLDTDILVAHLVTLVERGRFVDPDPDGWFDPDWTPGPNTTPGPGETDGPTGPDEAVELRQALSDGLVSVTGTGDGLQSLDLEVTSEVDFGLEVDIEVGTRLEPSARGTQLMVVLEAQTVSLAAEATVEVTLDVACAEMHQDQPTGDDTFRVLDDPPQADLVRLLGIPEFREQTGRVQQFAVWTITNDPKRNGFVGLTSGFSPFGTGPSNQELDTIRDLFETAGIDTGKYRALK